MTTYVLRVKSTGEEVELLDFAGQGLVFVGPPGRPEQGRLVDIEDLEPNPWLLVIGRGFVPWTERLLPRPPA